jgi:hypothetical protein
VETRSRTSHGREPVDHSTVLYETKDSPKPEDHAPGIEGVNCDLSQLQRLAMKGSRRMAAPHPTRRFASNAQTHSPISCARETVLADARGTAADAHVCQVMQPNIKRPRRVAGWRSGLLVDAFLRDMKAMGNPEVEEICYLHSGSCCRQPRDDVIGLRRSSVRADICLRIKTGHRWNRGAGDRPMAGSTSKNK